VSFGRQTSDLIVHGIMVSSSDTVAQREHASDNDIVKWLYEESDFDLNLSDEEQTVFVKNDIKVRQILIQTWMKLKVRMMFSLQQVTGTDIVNLIET
jgi:hypothetical protein